MVTRAGFVALAGRPNVGKSTLVNALVGRKIAIVSDKPQTTRRAIRGVATSDDAQLVLVDLPGVQRPRDELTRRMQRRVETELADSDAALFVLNAQEGVGPGDRFIAAALENASVPVVIALNKVDRLRRPQLVEMLTAVAELGIGDDIFPISARAGEGVDARAQLALELAPGRGADLLDHPSTASDQDPLLRFGLDPQARVDDGQVLARALELLDDHLDGVRHLLEGAAQHLLTDQLGEQHLLTLVGAFLDREEERALRQQPA